MNDERRREAWVHLVEREREREREREIGKRRKLCEREQLKKRNRVV